MRYKHCLLFMCSHNRTSHSCTLRRSRAGILPRHRGIRGVTLGADGVYLARRTKRIFHLRQIAECEEIVCRNNLLAWVEFRKTRATKIQIHLAASEFLERDNCLNE